MSSKRLLFILFVIQFTACGLGQTITSTTADGNWEAPSTWVGGVIPTQNNDVIINGVISVTSGNSVCKNLTINSGKILQNGGGLGWLSLHVNGNLINNGIIRNNPSGNTFNLEIWRNVTNNGEWTNGATYLPGQNDQYISQTPGKLFNCEFGRRDANGNTFDTGILIASTDLTFRKQFNLQAYISGVGYYSGTLDMANKSLTLSGDAQIVNGIVKDAANLWILEEAYLNNITFQGSTILHGRGVITSPNVTFEGDLTVADTLQNGGGLGWLAVHIKGNLTNNGVIRNNKLANTLNIEAWGNVTNNGEWTNGATYLPGQNDQHISQTPGKFFNCEFGRRDANGNTYDTGKLIASTDLTFIKSFNLQGYISGVGYYSGTLDMANKSLTLSGDAQIVNGTVKDAAHLWILEEAYLNNITFQGATILHGRGVITSPNVTFEGDLTVADTLQNGGGLGWLAVHVKGNLVNNGVIRNNKFANTLNVEAWGNITNNGEWTNGATYLPGQNDQHISQASGKFFNCEFGRRDANGNTFDTGKLIASTDLSFKKQFNLQGYISGVGYYSGSLDMANKNLSLSGDAQIFSGTVKNVADLTVLENAYLWNITFEGNITIRGRGRIDNGNVFFNGNVTVMDTLQNGGGLGWLTSTIKGDVINYGTIKNNYAGNSLILDISGSIYNYGNWTNLETHINTEGADKKISGTFNTTFYMVKSGSPAAGNIYIDGKLISKKEIIFKEGIQLIVNNGCLFQNDGSIRENGAVINNGTFTSTHNLNWDDPLNNGLNAGITLVDRNTLENVNITFYNNSFHPLMTSSAKQWWRIKGKGSVGSYKLTLKYNNELLNGFDPGLLEVFVSPDSGRTWNKISNPLNTVRDPVNNTIVVGNDNYPVSNGFGDVILSSGDVIAVPSISSAIGGRSQIRVGPPNRYTISYWNNNNYPTDKFCFVLNTNMGVHIKSILSKEISTGHIVEIPIDSLTFDGEKDEVILIVEPLGPKEARSYDIILTAEPGLLVNKPSELITFTAIALWVGGAILEEFVSNTIVEGCYEMWRPVSHDQSLTDASVNCVKNSINKAVTVENGAKGIAKKAATEIIEKTGKAVVWPVALAKDIYDCLGNTIKGMKDYVNGNFDKQSKNLTKVTSWDPNAKEGPGGFGNQGYMATNAPMLYTIFFENKKEATAPAYQVTVLDTLDSNVFDVSTVEFLGMSHSMGVASRQGNILKWDFVEIELPPNVTPPEGEGWVKFIVHPKNNLATGTQLKNKAVIKFDLNPWLATNDFINTLDYDPPVSTPTSLIALSGVEGVALSWNANDVNGSGIKNSSVYMAVNEGPFTLASVSDSNSAIINLKWIPDAKYKLYVLSQDNVGNAEKNPSQIMEIITGTGDNKIIPETFEVSQNYPNPFNPETKINFSIPERGFVELKIFNILGQEIETLINEEKEIGYYNVNWDAAKYSSGVYLYKISYKGKTFARKMLLLK